MESDEGRRPRDHELLERSEHPPPRRLAIDVVDDQLRDQRVVEVGNDIPGPNARIDAHPPPGRLSVGRDPPWRRHETARAVLGVDPALDRVAAKLDVGLREAQRLPGGDENLLAHDVDARHLLGHGVLDLDTGVHLEEVVGAVRWREAPRSSPPSDIRPLGQRRRRSCRCARAAPRRRQATASPRRASGGAAGSCSRARRGG